MAAIGAKLCPRFDVLLSEGFLGDQLDDEIKKADLMITAEGAIDLQTSHGKVPAEIAHRAAKYNKLVMAIAGTLGRGANCVYDIGIDAINSIMPAPMPLEYALLQSENLLIDSSERVIKTVVISIEIASGQPLNQLSPKHTFAT